MKIATSELEHLREEVKNCHRIIKDLQKKREFVGLTKEDKWEIVQATERDDRGYVMALVEAKLRSKNEDRN
jgi:hypothetical protein